MKHYHFNAVTSTNDVAQKLVDKKGVVVVTADYQTQGRGRYGRIWYGNEYENVYCSFVFSHKVQPSAKQLIAYQGLGCLVALYTLNDITKIRDFLVKYPNDIVYCDVVGGRKVFKKICGVLVENNFSANEIASTVIGMGINVHQVEFEEEIEPLATSLALLKQKVNPKEIIEVLKDKFAHLYKLSADEIFKMWERELKLDDRKIALRNDPSIEPGKNLWRVVRLNENGSLTIRNLFDFSERNIDNGASVEYIE